MSRHHIECLLAPLAACVLSLPASGCRDRGKIEAVTRAPIASLAPIASTAPAAPAEAPPVEAAAGAIETRDVKPKGACTESDRTDYVHDASRNFVKQLRSCSKETWAKNAKNMACLSVAMPSLSEGCAQCFANMASCARDNCKMACMLDSKSDGCINCANSHCQGDLVRCTGVARADLP